MKRLWMVVAFLAMVAAGCTRSTAVLETWVAGDGEVSTFRVVLETGGAEVGHARYAVSRQDGDWVLRNEVTLGSAGEVAVITLEAGNLRPRRLELEAVPAGLFHLEAGYGDRTATVRLTQGGKTEDHTITLPQSPFYEGDSFLHVLRSMPLADGYRTQSTVVMARGLTAAVFVVEVKGCETVRVPAGEFEAWAVHLPELFQTVWVAVEPPHPVVRILNQGAGVVFELVEFQPGR